MIGNLLHMLQSSPVHVHQTGFVDCAPDWCIDRSWSERLQDYDLWLIVQGRGRMQMDRQTVSLEPGRILWLAPGSDYRAEQSPDDPLTVCFVHFHLTNHPIRPVNALPTHWLSNAFDFHTQAIRRIIALSRPANPETDRRLADRLCHLLLMDMTLHARHAAETSVGDPLTETIGRLALQIRAEPARQWSVSRMAKTCRCSADHFSRRFKQIIGQPPGRYLLQCRLQTAAQLLIESSMPIKQIAHVMGYRDVYFFTRQFTEHMHTSPGRYRYQHRHANEQRI